MQTAPIVAVLADVSGGYLALVVEDGKTGATVIHGFFTLADADGYIQRIGGRKVSAATLESTLRWLNS